MTDGMQPIAQRNYAYDLQTFYGKGSRRMETDIQGMLNIAGLCRI